MADYTPTSGLGKNDGTGATGPTTKLPSAFSPTKGLGVGSTKPVKPVIKTPIKKGATRLFTLSDLPKTQDQGGLAPIASFGKSFLDFLMTGNYFTQGMNYQGTKDAELSDAAFKKKYGYTRSDVQNNPLTWISHLAPLVQAGAQNVQNAREGKKAVTAVDVVRLPKSIFKVEKDSPAEFWTALGLDITQDPVTFIPGGTFLRPIKAITTGASTFIKEAKLAAGTGKISEKLAPKTEGAISTTLKPGAAILEQYTRKPIISENLKTTTGQAIRVKNLEKLIGEKLTFKVTQLPEGTRATLAQTLGSSIEAGAKATAATWLELYAKNDLKKIAQLEARTARKLAKKAGSQVAEKAPDLAAPATDLVQKGVDNVAVLDNEMLKVVPEVVKKTRVLDLEAKAAQKSIALIEKLSKGAKGVSAGGKNIRSEVEKILAKESEVSKFANALKPEVLSEIKTILSGSANPLDVILKFASSGVKQKVDVAKIMLDKRVVGTTGQSLSLREMINKGIKFETLSATTKKKIAAQFAVFTTPGEIKLSELNTLLDAKTAKAIADTGALRPTGAVNSEALAKILKTIPDGSKKIEKTYENFADLIGGLKAGDNLDFSLLEQLLKAIDPTAAPLKQVGKALDKKTAYEMMKNILVGQGAQTVYEAQRRLDLMNADVLLKAQGLSLSDIIASYVSARLGKEAEALPAALEANRTKASENVARWMDSQDPKVQDMLRDVLYAINSGLMGGGKKQGEQGQFAFIKNILGQEDVLTVTSTFGDVAIKSKKIKRAVLPNQLNQSVEARIFANLAGMARFKNKGATNDQILADLVLRTTMLNDSLLAVLGGKIAHQKFWVKGAEKHYVFNNMGDFVKIFRETGKGDLVLKALVPDTNKLGIKKTDALSTIAIGKAIRHIAEMSERNLDVTRDEIIGLLKSRAKEQTAWTPTYKKQVDEFVGDIADHLVTPDVIKRFRDLHTQRAMASVEDAIGSAESLTSDLYNTMFEGFKVAIDKNIDSTASRAQLARDWFNKFVYASGIFKQEQGDVAEAVFQAAAMIFMKKGKIDLGNGVSEVLVGSATSRDPEARRIWEESMDAIRNIFKYDTSSKTPAAGREMLKKPTPEQIAAATDALTGAKEAFIQHAKDGVGLTGYEEIKTWEKTHYALQADLNKARTAARELSIPTHNWNGFDWVPSEQFDRNLALQGLKDAGRGVIVTDKGILTITDAMVDSAVEPIKMYKMNAAQRKTFMDAWTKDNAVGTFQRATGLSEEKAQQIVDNIAEYEKLPLSPMELGQRLIQEETAQVYEDATIKVVRGAIDKGALKRTKLQEGEIKPSFWQRRGEAMSATSGRWTLRSILTRADTSLNQTISNIADVAQEIAIEYKALKFERPEAFGQAFKYALSKTDIPADAEPIVAELAINIRKILDPLFGNPETTIIGASGIHPESLAQAFKKYGLTKEAGFINPSTMSPKELSDYASWMPFTEVPASILGTPEEEIFRQNAAKFAEDGLDPLVMVTRLAQAVQFAKTEQAFVADFAQNFSYLNRGLTAEQAIKEGWVKIEGIAAGGTDLTKLLPAPEKGGLFPPHIAEEFLSLNREWNKLYNSKGMPNWVRTVMDITGFFKATQTIFRPGHHITNMFGDTTTAMIAGTLNPIHWKQGLELAKMFWSQDFKATWGAQKLDNKFIRLFQSYKNYGNAWEGKTKDGLTTPSIAISRDGKLSKVNLSNEDLFQAFKERGIILGNIYHNDIQGLYETILAESGQYIGAKRKLREIAAAKIRLASQKMEQPVGAFASYYGNIPRAAHAMQVIQSRAWSSIDEALNAATEAVTRYHPTIQSLAAGERKIGRSMITYYTWLRVAHNALIDMAINHTGAMLIPSKIQYIQATQAGAQPKSVGNPWGNEIYAPNYMTYSVYGPSELGPNGPVVYKRSFLPLDVLDTWNLSYDPAKSVDENLIATGKQISKTVGSSLNPFLQVGVEMLDPNLTSQTTGEVAKVKDGETALNAIFAKTGFYNLAKSLGMQVPGKEFTPEDRARMMRNWLTGQKETFVETPANIKNYRTEYKSRFQSWFENQGK